MSPTHDSISLKMAHFDYVAEQKWNSNNYSIKKETMKQVNREFCSL